MTRYLDLAEYFWLAEQVTGTDAATLANTSRSDLADSALHAPAAGFGDDDFYPDVFDKAAVLACRLAWNHVVHEVDEMAAAPVHRLEQRGVPRTALATAVLVASSFTLHAGERALHAGDRRRVGQWVLLTAVLGTAFVTNQALEWAELPFSVSSHAYGSLFYVLTGFHGLHSSGDSS